MQTCEHLSSHPQQPSATVDGTRRCIVCASDWVAATALTDKPEAITSRIVFETPLHFTALMGSLMVQWSYIRMTASDGREANRLARTIRSLLRHHGRVVFGAVDAESSFAGS